MPYKSVFQSVAHSFQKNILNASGNVSPLRIVQEFKKHIHQKQRKAKAISESLILSYSTLYTDFAFEDVLQLIFP